LADVGRCREGGPSPEEVGRRSSKGPPTGLFCSAIPSKTTGWGMKVWGRLRVRARPRQDGHWLGIRGAVSRRLSLCSRRRVSLPRRRLAVPCVGWYSGASAAENDIRSRGRCPVAVTRTGARKGRRNVLYSSRFGCQASFTRPPAGRFKPGETKSTEGGRGGMRRRRRGLNLIFLRNNSSISLPLPLSHPFLSPPSPIPPLPHALTHSHSFTPHFSLFQPTPPSPPTLPQPPPHVTRHTYLSQSTYPTSPCISSLPH